MTDQLDTPAREDVLPCWRVELVVFGRLSRVVTEANAPMDARGTASRGRPERRRGRLWVAQAMRPVDAVDIVEHVEPAGIVVEIESRTGVVVVARERAGAVVGHIGPRRQRPLGLAVPEGLGVTGAGGAQEGGERQGGRKNMEKKTSHGCLAGGGSSLNRRGRIREGIRRLREYHTPRSHRAAPAAGRFRAGGTPDRWVVARTAVSTNRVRHRLSARRRAAID